MFLIILRGKWDALPSQYSILNTHSIILKKILYYSKQPNKQRKCCLIKADWMSSLLQVSFAAYLNAGVHPFVAMNSQLKYHQQQQQQRKIATLFDTSKWKLPVMHCKERWASTAQHCTQQCRWPSAIIFETFAEGRISFVDCNADSPSATIDLFTSICCMSATSEKHDFSR